MHSDRKRFTVLFPAFLALILLTLTLGACGKSRGSVEAEVTKKPIQTAIPPTLAPIPTITVAQPSLTPTFIPTITLAEPSPTSTRAQFQSPPSPTTLRLLPTVSDNDLGFSSSSPVPRGNALPWFSLLLGVTDVIWPANDVVQAGSPNNATPQPESQYLLVGLSVECRVGDDDMCVFFKEELFQVIDESGATYNEVSDLVGIPNPFEPSDLDGGDTVEGYLAFMVPTTARDLVLIYWRYLWGETYFALE